MSITVSDLVYRFDVGEIQLPLMQRDYVWSPKKMISLLDSLYKGWPIGSFYIWQTQSNHPVKVRAGQSAQIKLDQFYGYLLDGQQRLTSLSLAIQKNAMSNTDLRAYFDIENQQFYIPSVSRRIRTRVNNDDWSLIPLSDLIEPSKKDESEVQKRIEKCLSNIRDHTDLGKLEMEYRLRLQKLARMLNRTALCDIFNDDHEEFAFEVFSRLNKGGTKLSTGEVEAARLASTATKRIVEPMRSLASEKNMRNLGINFVFLLRSLVTIYRGNCIFSKIPKNWAENSTEIERAWKKTEKSVRTLVDFLRSDLGWVSRRWLPSTLSLIPPIYAISKQSNPNLSDSTKPVLRKFLLISGLRGIFTGSPETKINSYVTSIKNTPGNIFSDVSLLLKKIPKNEKYRINDYDIDRQSSFYSPLMQAYLAYLVSISARSWPSGRTIHEVLLGDSSSDPIAVHHVFPKKLLQGNDVPIYDINTMSNYSILTQEDNEKLSDDDPQIAWQNLKPNQREYASTQLFIHGYDKLLSLEAFDEFKQMRAEKISTALNTFLDLK